MATTVPPLLWSDLAEEMLTLTSAPQRPMMTHLLQATRESAEDITSRELARELSILFLLAANPKHIRASPQMEAAMH